MQARYELAMTACALLLNLNKAVYSPILHWHNVALQYPDISYDSYLNNDLVHLRNCNCLIVLTSSGWDKSRGIAAEVEEAKALGMKIEYFNPITGEISDVPTTN
jgi:hypothetical protein